METLEYWVCTCHVTAETAQARQWEGDTDEAVVDVIMQTYSAKEIQRQIHEELPRMRLQLNRMEKTELILERFRREGMGLLDVITQAAENSPLRFGTYRPVLPDTVIVASLAEKLKGTAPAAVSFSETDWNALLNNKTSLWAVIDGVNCRNIQELISAHKAPHACLAVTTDEKTKAFSPWLVRLESDKGLIDALRQLPHNDHWGVLFHSPRSIKTLYDHFRRYTRLWTPVNENAPVYFRFYDPRVLIDSFMVMPEWKLKCFSRGIEAFYVPVTPFALLPKDIDLTVPIEPMMKVSDCQGRLLSICLSDALPDRALSYHVQTFDINEKEFVAFNSRQLQKSTIKMARDLLPDYPDTDPNHLLNMVDKASRLGQETGMASIGQIRVLAKCCLAFGDEFPGQFPKMTALLHSRKIEPWAKRKQIEAWLPIGVKLYRKKA